MFVWPESKTYDTSKELSLNEEGQPFTETVIASLVLTALTWQETAIAWEILIMALKI